MKKKCCFIGHRKISMSEEDINRLKKGIEDLILEGVEIFYFCSRSDFKFLCWKLITELKEKYPQIVRIDVRVDCIVLGGDYLKIMLEDYENYYASEKIYNSGRLAYVIANQEMIDMCDVVVVYFDENNKNKGTRMAVEYAQKKKKRILNFFNN